MESKNPRGGIRLWQLGVCFLLFLGAVFFRSVSGRAWNPSGGAQTLREFAGKVGEALAQSPVVEAFAEGFRSGERENAVEAAVTTRTTAVSQVKPSEGTVTATSQANSSENTAKTADKATTTASTTVKQTEQTKQTKQSTETSLPLLTKRAGGKE